MSDKKIIVTRDEEGEPTGYKYVPRTDFEDAMNELPYREQAYLDERNQAWEEATNPLAKLTFAELILLGTHIAGSNRIIDEELARREQQIIEGAGQLSLTRLADPEWD